MNIKIGKLIYRGKAKDIYKTDDPEKVVIKFRDDITAGDGKKKDTIEKKGFYNSLISAKLFEVLRDAGIKTQYIELIKPNYILALKLDMIPIEIITRNIAAGSLLRRFPFKPGQRFESPIIQIDYKSDEYKDPMLNDDIAMALGLVKTKKELVFIREITLKINKILGDFLKSRGILLPDFKIEYGYDANENIVLGDEISPDTCRFWDLKTQDVLDKDLFRKGEAGVIEAYRKVALRLLDDEDMRKWNITTNL